VALTFHLGGDPTLVGRLLDLLRTSGLRCTLFAIGDWITAHPDLTRRAVADGHELGNHTRSHLDMAQLSRRQVRDEIVGGGQALVPFIGSIGRWFRPSGTDVPGPVVLEEAGRAGYAVSVGYDVDSRDHTDPASKVVVDRVNASVRDGSIVSLHFGHASTIAALPAVLQHLSSVDLRPVTVSELLAP
jgi:peptidoglycan/xylan/chitin deacetylase (PgdA/CDA1 family)